MTISARQLLIRGYLHGALGALFVAVVFYYLPPGSFGLGRYAVQAMAFGIWRSLYPILEGQPIVTQGETASQQDWAKLMLAGNVPADAKLPEDWRAWMWLGLGVGAIAGGVSSLYGLRWVWSELAFSVTGPLA